MPANPSVSRRLCTVLGVLLASACADNDPPPPEPAVAERSAEVQDAVAPAVREAAPAPPPPSPQSQFWAALSALCGNAYAGYLTVGTEPSDRDFGEADMLMHVRDCSDTEIRIPFHVGDNRSRTWIVRKEADALTLKHHHLDQAGQVDDPHDYGGRTQDDGSARRQQFVVDDQTRSQLPETRYNVWAIDIVAGTLFAYELQRPEEDRFFRVEFELDTPIADPPPAWGHANDPG